MATALDGFDVITTQFDVQLARTIAESKRHPHEVTTEAARGVLRRAIGFTPPSHVIDDTPDGGLEADAVWRVVQGGDAKRHGEKKVEADIRSLYAGPARAADLIVERGFPDASRGFWKAFKTGDVPRARTIFRETTGRTLDTFDGGELHAQRRDKRGAVRRPKRPFVYLVETATLDHYVKEKQKNVGWLAAGWNFAAVALGIGAPQWILRHNSPGAIEIRVNGDDVAFVITNNVRFVDNVEDLNRRVQMALDQQGSAMARRSAHFMKTVLKQQGLVVTAIAGDPF